MTRTNLIDPALFKFLRDLKIHNDRAWFQANKARYERDVRDPLLDFIARAAAPLKEISGEIHADPRPSGGSLFRIHRDTRFSKDKSPYKTYAALQFRHRAFKDVHAPGFYLHLEPGNVFAGAGLWQPEAAPLRAVRSRIASVPSDWKRAVGSREFKTLCRLEGESSSRTPTGFSAVDPLIVDIRRKDYMAVARFSEAEAVRPDFPRRFIGFCRAASPLNAFLCAALRLPW